MQPKSRSSSTTPESVLRCHESSSEDSTWHHRKYRYLGRNDGVISNGMCNRPVSAFQSYFQRALNALRNPSSLAQSAQSATQSAAASPTTILNSVRNLSTAQLIAGGVVLAEVLGFFTVGEMVGRFKVVGYHGGVPEHH
jgi:hypothetical protein